MRKSSHFMATITMAVLRVEWDAVRRNPRTWWRRRSPAMVELGFDLSLAEMLVASGAIS